MADGEQGMPLTFQNFLEKMRHPSASELVKSIKVRRPGRYLLNSSPLSVPTRPSHPRAPSLFQSTQAFISSFGDAQMSGNAQRDSDEDGRRIQAFLRDTEAAFRGHPAWRGASEEELEASGEGLEKYLSTKLYPNIFAVVNEERTLDDVLGRRIAALRTFIRPEHLDIPECFRVEASLALARNELVKVNNFKAPRDKLVCVLNTCRVINNLLNVSAGNRPAGADDFLPVLIYVVMLANPPRLESNLRYIARFRLESRLVSEAAYFYTNLVSATHFLTTCDHAAFTNLDADVFEAHMAAEGIAVGDAEGTTDGEGGVDGGAIRARWGAWRRRCCEKERRGRRRRPRRGNRVCRRGRPTAQPRLRWRRIARVWSVSWRMRGVSWRVRTPGHRLRLVGPRWRTWRLRGRRAWPPRTAPGRFGCRTSSCTRARTIFRLGTCPRC